MVSDKKRGKNKCKEKDKISRINRVKKQKKATLLSPTTSLKKWVRILGVGPVVLYQELLTYCHKEKYIAWPTINSLCQQLGIAKTTLLRYQNTLIKFGLIKNIARGKSTTGHYKNNIYQITSLEELSGHPDPGKIIDFLGSKMKPDRYQNDTYVGSNMKLSLVSNRYPNNNHLNSINITTTTNREKDAVVAVVNFKKLKKKGEEKMQAVREQMVELDFKEEFVEKILKDYPPRKIEEKLDLLMERRNIQSPAGWLVAALKNDYQYVEQPSRITPHPHLDPPPSRGRKFNVIANDRRERGNLVSTPEQVSREKALEAIRLIQDNLSACISPLPSGKRTIAKKNPYPLSPGGRGLG